MRFQNQLFFSVLPSTNTYLKEKYQNLPNYTVIIARHQTAGRGRMERTWVDGDDLLLSVLIKDDLDPQKISQLALVSAAAVWKTLFPLLPVKIKWPNDIVYKNQKISGILIESIINSGNTEAVIIGIGINVNTEIFPEILSQKASSLFLETEKKYDLEELKTEFLKHLDFYYQDFLDSGVKFLKICRDNSSLVGRWVKLNDFKTKKRARVIRILENGNILLEVEGVLQEFSSGEISLQENYQ